MVRVWSGAFIMLLVSAKLAHTAEVIIEVSRFASGLSRPVYLTQVPGDRDRLFVLEQHTGRIQILDRATGATQATPFLDLSNLSTGGEQGLLGLAFDPNYEQTGHFYVNFTDRSGRTNVTRYSVSDDPNVADPNSAFPILTIDQPNANHNAGWMDFGPDDQYLYIATGDGGGSNDSGSGHTSGSGNAQDLSDNLLGKMLRINVNADDFPTDASRNYGIPADNPFVGIAGNDEIWAYGLRNPWRNSFDRQTGDLWIADVGQNAWEEINYQPSTSAGGENYGWRLREGNTSTSGVGGSRPDNNVDPVYVYPHDASDRGGFSVTGGFVYRGPIEPLQGDYFFADYVSNQIWSFEFDETTGDVVDFQVLTDKLMVDEGAVQNISSFGEDADGNLYIVSLRGDIFRLDDATVIEDLVSAGSTWRFLDDGSDQGEAWRTSDFDDSAWNEGPAQLGYGDNDEATVVEFGGDPLDRHVTTYFRHTFDVEDPSQVEQLFVDLLRDDGAAVYLNGTEIIRSNLVDDAGYTTLATTGISGPAEDEFVRMNVDVGLLIAGTNLLAVEVHQASTSSSDISFDLRLAAAFAQGMQLAGDFNHDGVLNSQDIDQLTQALADGDRDARYDLNQDGVVNSADRDVWISDIKRTWKGDSNLDGEFDESDLVDVFQLGLYEDEIRLNATWESGDWNGDLDFDTSDLVAAFVEGGYRQGPRGAVAAVPEPSGSLLCLLATFTMIIQGRPQSSMARVQ